MNQHNIEDAAVWKRPLPSSDNLNFENKTFTFLTTANNKKTKTKHGAFTC